MSIHWIKSEGGFDSNIFLIVGDMTALIDSGTGLDMDPLIGRIDRCLDGRRLDYLILTHAHFDHVGGANGISKRFGCKVLIGEHDLKAVSDADSSIVLNGLFNEHIEPIAATGLKDGQMVDLIGHELKVIHTPGHTKGSICLYDRMTRSLFTGDTVFESGVGRTDFPTGSARELIGSLRDLTGYDIGGMYPGHGECPKNGSLSVERGLRMMGGI